MWISLSIAVLFVGTDPEIVFADHILPTVGREERFDDFDAPLLTDRVRSLPDDSDIFRGQSISDPELGLPMRVVPGHLCDSDCFHEFRVALNPFIPEEVHTIPNYYDPFGTQMGTGCATPRGYRLGWTTYNDFAFLPASPARGAAGSMQITEWNSYMKYSGLIAPGVLFNGTGWFDAHWWQGPIGKPVPGQVDLFSFAMELGLFNDGPWSGQIAFHPQIVETYDAAIDRNAFNFDGRAIAMYQASPQWSFVGGLGIWDRVDLLFVPHAGVIWTPNNRWEFRILYPRTRISYFLGTWGDADVWLYGQAEYVAEAWQSADKEAGTSERMQMTDDRLTLGVRSDSGRYSVFVEGGYVFNRQIKFSGSTAPFELENGGMIRAGLRY